MLKSKYSKYMLECGVDEAGRGCLAGPVTAAAVILNPDFNHELIDDSKKLSMTDREKLSKIIIHNSISYSVQNVYPEKIDEVNILNASIEAKHKAITKINHKIDLLIIDGNRFKEFKKIKHKCIIKGDSKYISIASASILAKTHREDINPIFGPSGVSIGHNLP